MTSEPSPAPAAREKILRVAERLFAQRGYRNVTIRDIANEAGVTHPLIYFYWKSKHDLLASVIEANQARVRATGATQGKAREAILAITRDSVGRSRSYLLTVARALADGMRPDEWPGGFPGVERILQVLLEGREEADDAEVRETTAVAVAALIGWMMIEDELLEVVGLSSAERLQAREVLVRSIERIFEPVLPEQSQTGLERE